MQEPHFSPFYVGVWCWGVTETGDRRLENEGSRPETGDRRPETGDRRPETGDLRPETATPPTPSSTPAKNVSFIFMSAFTPCFKGCCVFNEYDHNDDVVMVQMLISSEGEISPCSTASLSNNSIGSLNTRNNASKHRVE